MSSPENKYRQNSTKTQDEENVDGRGSSGNRRMGVWLVWLIIEVRTRGLVRIYNCQHEARLSFGQPPAGKREVDRLTLRSMAMKS